VVEAPKPPPPRIEPEVKPPPPVAKPDIVLQRSRSPARAEEDPPPKPKDDLELKKRMQEQLAMEQKALDQQRQERQLRELLAAQKADAARKATAARASALGEYIAGSRPRYGATGSCRRTCRAIRRRYSWYQLPTGEVLSIRMLKSSGNPAYDTAVERAILKSSPLPLPSDRSFSTAS
jgi:colicin import membrane protein